MKVTIDLPDTIAHLIPGDEATQARVLQAELALSLAVRGKLPTHLAQPWSGLTGTDFARAMTQRRMDLGLDASQNRDRPADRSSGFTTGVITGMIID